MFLIIGPQTHMRKRGPKSGVADESRSICHDTVGIHEHAIRRAALVTLRRAILENLPPRPEREKRACSIVL